MGEFVMKFTIKSLLLASTLLGSALCAPAYGQTQPGRTTVAQAGATSIGEVVVTARRIQERLQDVPISVTVFNQQSISNKNLTNLSDLALYTPSLGTTNVLGNNQTVFSLRGFNQDLSTAATVGVFFADVVALRGASNQQPAGDGAGPGTFFDLQNVQVLKGPQGTLFGRNTTGGAILIVPNKPTNKHEGYLEASYGNYNMWRLQGMYNTPLGDHLRLRLGFDREKRDGYVHNNTGIGPNALNNVNYWSGRASLVWDISPTLENYSVATYIHSNDYGEINTLITANPAPGGPFAPPHPGVQTNVFAFLSQQELVRYAGRDFYSVENIIPQTRNQLDEWQYINTTTWKALENLTVKNIISYGQLKTDLQTEVFGDAWDLSDLNPYLGALHFPFPFSYQKNTLLELFNANPNGAGHTAQQSTFTEELQFQGHALENKLSWQNGFYFEDSLPLGDAGSVSGNLVQCPNLDYNCYNPFLGAGSVGLTIAQKKIKTMGVYAQASYDITDQLKFTAGYRYTWDKQSATGELINFSVPFNPFNPTQIFTARPTQPGPGHPANSPCVIPTASPALNCVETVKTQANAPTWLLDLDYKPTRDILAYIKYSRGYRTGGISFQLPSTLRTYGPEKVNTYEAGLKYTLNGPIHGIIDLAAFYNDFSNQQIAVSAQPKVAGTAAQAQGVVNAGKSRIWGIELESTLQLFQGFILSAGYSYLNTKIDQLNYPPFSDPLYQLNVTLSPHVGDPIAYSPENKLSVTGEYTLPLDESIGHLAISATYTFIDKQITNYSFRDTSGKLTGYSYLAPRNLLDLNLNWNHVKGSNFDVSVFANNVTQKHYYTYILDTGLDFLSAQLGTPRMFGVRLRYSFGS
jgi:iron complex outermembrane receptor protein